MDRKAFDALVNKGRITHVGAYPDAELLPTDDFCSRHITCHEVAAALDDAKIDTMDELVTTLMIGGKIDVEGNIVLKPSATVVISSDTELNLNGNSISGEVSASFKDNGDMLRISGSNSTIKNGTIIDNHAWDGKSSPAGTVFIDNGSNVVIDNVDVTGIYPIWVKGDGSKVTIKSGNFKSTVSQTIYVQGQSKIIIEGGEFEAPSFGSKNYCLNVKDSDYNKAKPATDYIEVRGGRFINFNPAMNAEVPTTSFVAVGYESVEVEPNVFEVRKVEEPVVPEESVVPETPVEEPTKAPAKKSRKNSAAPSVDPVE